MPNRRVRLGSASDRQAFMSSRPKDRAWCQHSINAGPAHLQALGYLRRTNTRIPERTRLGCFRSCCRRSAFVLALALRLRDPFALALQHHLALELPDGTDHGYQQLARRGAGVHPEVKDIQMRALAFHALHDLQQVLRRAS